MNKNDVNEMLGLPSEGNSTEQSSLMSKDERESLLSPPPPWYARTSVQFGIFLAIAGIFGTFAYSILGGGGAGPKPVVAQDTKSAREIQMQQALLQEQQDRKRLEQEAWQAKQPPSTKITVVPHQKAPTKPLPRPVAARNVVAPPKVIYRDRVVRQPSIPRPAPVARMQPAPQPIPQRMPVSMPMAPPEDPNAAASRLASLGVVVDGAGSQIASAPSDPSYGAQNADYIPSGVPQIQADYPAGTVATPSPGMPDGQNMATNSLPPSPTGAFQIPKRERVTAKLLDEVRWNQGESIDGQTFEAKLSKDFGSVPKGAIIKLQASTGNQSGGMVSLTPLSIQVGQTDYPIPQGLKASVTVKAKRPGSGFGLSNILQFGAGVASSGLSNSLSGGSSFANGAISGAGSQLINGVVGDLTRDDTIRTSYFVMGDTVKLQATEDISL